MTPEDILTAAQQAQAASDASLERRQGERRARRDLGEKCACPNCSSVVSKVLPRTVPQRIGYTRHRQCQACGAEYETRETPTRLLKPGTHQQARTA